MRQHQRHIAYVAALVAGTLIGFELPIANPWLSQNRSVEAVSSVLNDKDDAPLIRVLDPSAFEGVREVISPPAPAVDVKLPEGCESPVSFMTRSPLVNSAARCLT
jgi:hypothetical protein